MSRRPPTGALRLFLAWALLATSALAAVDGQQPEATLAWLQSEVTAYPAAPALESRLAGLVIDGREVGSEIILWQPDNFWLPYPALLGHLAVSARRQDGTLLLSTPGGEVALDPRELLRYRDELYISRDTLRDRLHIDIRFDPSA